jgi:hypothetical protein
MNVYKDFKRDPGVVAAKVGRLLSFWKWLTGCDTDAIATLFALDDHVDKNSDRSSDLHHHPGGSDNNSNNTSMGSDLDDSTTGDALGNGIMMRAGVGAATGTNNISGNAHHVMKKEGYEVHSRDDVRDRNSGASETDPFLDVDDDTIGLFPRTTRTVP